MVAAGAAESSVTFSVSTLVFGGAQASAAVTPYAKSPVEPGEKVNALEAYGPPAGVETVSAPCVQPARTTAGYAAEAGPEPASATALERANEPPAAPL